MPARSVAISRSNGAYLYHFITGNRELSVYHGWRLREDWGTVPKIFRLGRRPMHPSPQYFEKYCYWMRAVACRGSWMPGANEVLGCPQVKKNSGCPSYPGCPEPWTFSLTCYAFTLTFLHLPTLKKLPRWMPPAWMPGAVAPRHPPLHATAGCEAEYELTKKGLEEEFFVLK